MCGQSDSDTEDNDRSWTSPLTVLRTVGPKLVPFCKTVVIYFVLFLPQDQTSLLRCVIKCAPILSLVLFVLLHGMSLSKEYACARAILCGLSCSLVGDVLLSFDCFAPGLVSFGLAHVNYARAFGFKPLKLKLGAGLALPSLLAFNYVRANLQSPCLTFLVGAYVILISVMAWRAMARVRLFNDLWKWTHLCSSGGAVLFMVSDFLIGVGKFVRPVPYDHALIMATYYAAQLGIALSVVDSKRVKKSPTACAYLQLQSGVSEGY